MQPKPAPEPEPERPPEEGAEEAPPGAASTGEGNAGAHSDRTEEGAAAAPADPPSTAGDGDETADPRPREERKPSFLERPDYRVKLSVFNGPLDLLLYLIKRDEIDIHDIPIAHIAKEYVDFLDLMSEWNINNAGEFILMAATLMEIKSRMLLPEPPPLEDDEEWEDPRSELVRQLMEYKRYKEAALDLADRAEERARRFARPGERIKEEAEPTPVLGVSVWELAEAFREVLAATGADPAQYVVMDETPQEVYLARLRRKIEAERRLRFQDLFADEATRQGLIGMFLALLELCRLLVVRAEQPELHGDIWIVFVPESERAAAEPPEQEEEAPEPEVARPKPPWRGLDRKLPEIAFRQDDLDAEIDSIVVSEFAEHPPEPEVAALAPQDSEAGSDARASASGNAQEPEPSPRDGEPQPDPSATENGEAPTPVGTEHEAQAVSASLGERIREGDPTDTRQSLEGSETEGAPDDVETATVPLDSGCPSDDDTQETQTVALEVAQGARVHSEAPEPPHRPNGAEGGRRSLAGVSLRFRWLGPFGLCPCRLSNWRRVTQVSETHIAFVSHRRMLKGMRLQVVLDACALGGTLDLSGRVASCEKTDRKGYRLRVALAPFGVESRCNSLEAKKALRRLVREIGD